MKLDIDPSLLPPCYESPEVSAKVSELGAKATGLPAAYPSSVAAATSRPAPSATASSARGSCRRRWAPRGRLRPCRFARVRPARQASARLHRAGRWHVMGVVLAAGGSFQWFRNELGKAEIARRTEGRRPVFFADGRGSAGRPGREGLFFLPYLTGERTPHFDPDAKGAWVGLTVRHGRAI